MQGGSWRRLRKGENDSVKCEIKELKEWERRRAMKKKLTLLNNDMYTQENEIITHS